MQEECHFENFNPVRRNATILAVLNFNAFHIFFGSVLTHGSRGLFFDEFQAGRHSLITDDCSNSEYPF